MRAGAHAPAQTIDALCAGTQGAATARYITRKLFAFFANTAPPTLTIDTLTAAFIASDLSRPIRMPPAMRIAMKSPTPSGPA